MQGSTIPGTGPGGDDTFTILERPPLAPGTAMPDAITRWIDPGYFSALQIPLLSGCYFYRRRPLWPAKMRVSSIAAKLRMPGIWWPTVVTMLHPPLYPSGKLITARLASIVGRFCSNVHSYASIFEASGDLFLTTNARIAAPVITQLSKSAQ